jgi:hypothetical protein
LLNCINRNPVPCETKNQPPRDFFQEATRFRLTSGS